MKKFFLFILILISSFSIFSEKFSSNVLGQILSEEREDSEYVVDVESNGNFSLFRNGELILTRKTSTDGEMKTIIEHDFSSNSETTYKYRNYFPQNIHTESEEGYSDFSYFYDEDNLLYVSYSENGEVKYVEYYIRSATDNSLTGVKRINGLNLYGSTYIVADDTLYLNATDKLLVKDSFSIDEDNNIVFEKNGETLKYNLAGQLIMTSKGGETSSYEYDETGNLNKLTVENETVKTVSFYSNSSVYKTEEYHNGILEAVTDYNSEGFYRIKTVYSENKPFAKVFYENSNPVVSKIEYFN